MTTTPPPLTAPLDVADHQSSKALSSARCGLTQRALQAMAHARAALRRGGLDNCPTARESLDRLEAAQAVLDGLDVDTDGKLRDDTGRRWRPATTGDSITGGLVFVPDGLTERFDGGDPGPLGAMRVDGHAPDDWGDVCVAGAYGALWYPLALCYLPE